MHAGWWAYPIYGSDGDYSPLLKTALEGEGEWKPEYEFTEDQKKLNKARDHGVRGTIIIHTLNKPLLSGCESL